jgi:hypothetical protein
VLGAFIATAWLIFLVASLDAYCAISKSFNDYLSENHTIDPNQNFERLLDRIEGLGLSTKTDSNSGHSGRAFQAVVHALGLRKTSSWILSLFRKQRPRSQKFAELTLDSLCDIQVVTGSAIIIAGLVEINTMTFYHQQLVMNDWFLTFILHHVHHLDQKPGVLVFNLYICHTGDSAKLSMCYRCLSLAF